MKKTFLIGAVGYGLVEVLWRGRTHPSMLLTGGVCLCVMKKICSVRRAIVRNALRCAAFITLMELVVGLLVNGLGRMNVWDYSKERGNVLGQICPRFSAAWFALSLPVAIYFRGKNERKSFKVKAPLKNMNTAKTTL